MDQFTTIVLIAAIIIIVDWLLAGGAMTMTAMSMLAHPMGAGVLVVLILVLVFLVGGARWP